MAPSISSLPARMVDLRSQYPDDPRLAHETIYSLPPALSLLLAGSPYNLLTSNDLEFELLLRSACGTGIHCNRPFATIVLDQFGTGETSFPGQLWPTSVFEETDLTQTLLDEGMTAHRHGQKSSTARRIRTTRQKISSQLRLLMRGYVAWLIHDTTFRKELGDLRNAWNAGPSTEMPTCNANQLDPQQWRGRGGPEAARWRDQTVLASRFLRRWSLARLQTWDLPIPVAADTLMTRTPAASSLGATAVIDRLNDPAGMSLFLPWWLFVDRDFSISQLKAYHAARLDLTRFDSWLEPKKKDRFGHARYEMLLDLHTYLNLALKVRYPDKIHGKVGALDQAFVRWFKTRKPNPIYKLGVESVKRIRIHGARLMRANADDEAGEPSSQAD
jgi:hypothetical protein